MRIDSCTTSQTTGDSQSVRRQQQSTETAQSAGLAQDSAQISSQNLGQQVAGAPDIRQDRVDSIRQSMAAGTYNVSNKQLAGAMFGEFFNS